MKALVQKCYSRENEKNIRTVAAGHETQHTKMTLTLLELVCSHMVHLVVLCVLTCQHCQSTVHQHNDTDTLYTLKQQITLLHICLRLLSTSSTTQHRINRCIRQGCGNRT